MSQNILVGLFEVESEGYQAMTELKQDPGDKKAYLSEAVLIKKENGTLTKLDGFDTGADTMNDMAAGGVIGALCGVLGGPVGVLLGGSYGMLVGSVIDSEDAMDGASKLEMIAGKLIDGDIAIVGLAFEEDESILDKKLEKFKVTIIRYDAATVAAEVEEAQKMAKEMARQARKELRDEKKQERKDKREEKKAKLSAQWEGFKEKMK